MQIKLAAVLAFAASLYGQANPTITTFVQTMFQQNLLMRQSVAGLATSRPKMCGHQLFLAQNYPLPGSGQTISTINAFTDSLLAAGATCIEANVDGNLFVTNNTAVLSVYDAAWTHAVTTDGMTVKLNFGVGGPAGPSAFTISACGGGFGVNCVTTPSDCASGCFQHFADYQNFVLNNPTTGSCNGTFTNCPMYSMLKRWGASGILNTSLENVTGAFELLNHTCGGLNPHWTSGSDCTAANWAGFAAAFVNMVRGISSGVCVNCPASASAPADLSLTFSLVTDAALYSAVCIPGTLLTAIGFDAYVQPTNSANTYFASGAAQTFLTACRGSGTANKKIFLEENVPPNWVPSWTPQSESNAYWGGVNRNWVNTDIDWYRSVAQWAAGNQIYRISQFDTFKWFYLTTQPSCPNAPVPPGSCTTPDPTCGIDGTQCLGDIASAEPYLSYAIAYLASNSVSLTPQGLAWKQLATNWITGAQ